MIIRKALEAPLRQIAENTGVEPSGIVAYVQSSGEHEGYDFMDFDEMNWAKGKKDLMQAGIVDPVKVTRLALENAVSIASTLVTAEAIVVDKPEPKSDAPAGGMPGGMGGMGGMY
jgi:chaperonin GroEL